ncbi:WD domain, G-beta repeat [Rubripirellula obstinata]|uniref:WD domain, G-beta repeat n=1 Tax=Rubripirellula obstinata TaxID=406547 RepID=A0A5B1CMV8_9BACT|nr:SHD1 domain-containing protein [Rubripirellula obstinata]KAA1262348.1 WD domain, G-beta repeat [Rubripirellula obstinata]
MNGYPGLRVVLSSLAFLIGIAASATARNWSDRTGNYNVEAELVTVRDEKAYLEKTDGQITKVPLKLLSDDDLQFIASLPQYESQVKPLLSKDNSRSKAAAKTKTSTQMATIEVDAPSDSGSIRQFRSQRWGYKGLVFSSDGGYLFTLGNDNVTVMDVNASTQVVYQIGSGNREALAMSPDGNRLFAGSFDGSVLVWQYDGRGNLKPENEFSIPHGPVKCISVSPDNKHAISLHSSGIACLWEIDSGEVVGRFDGFSFHSAVDAMFSKRGGQAMVSDGRVAALIDVSSRKFIQQMPLASGIGQFVAFAPDGSSISAGRSYDIQTFATQRTSQPTISDGNEIAWSADYSPGGRLLVSGGRQKVMLWNVKSGMQVQKFDMGDSGYVKHVAFSPDGIHFAAIGAPLGKLVEVFRLPDEERGR